ncbi:helicase HerA domain-containing protein [Microtetraspora fusca]|uniref:Helicase HerA domain-containing protein n=1 Tax=Microtetraspora fusca TaxID=1997 RepID=A0ABW6V839_MICFU
MNDLPRILDELPQRLPELMWTYGWRVAIAAFAFASLLTAVCRLLWRLRHVRLARDARLVEISCPPQADLAGAAALWAHLVGLLRPAWKRFLLGQPHLAFEYVGDAAGVRIQMWMPGSIPNGIIEKAVQSAWPGATATTRPALTPLPLHAAATGGRLALGQAEHLPLKHDHDADPLRALLGAMSGLAHGQHVTVQVLARPVTGARLGRAHRAAAFLRGGRSGHPLGELFDLITPGHGTMSGDGHPAELARMFPERAEQIRAILAKASQPRYEVAIRYGVATTASGADGRLRGRAHSVASVFALFTSGHQYLRRRRLRRPARALALRRLDRGYLLSVAELAALAHLPLDADAPGITRAGARPVAPSPAVPYGGAVRVLGDADSGPQRPVALSIADARHHIHVVGETGVGKSTLLANMILTDAAEGRGVLVIDPKGDLVGDVLARLPESAIGRTVVFDPADPGRPPSVNVLAGPDPAFAVESVVTIFHRCFSSAWGPRVDDLLRSACLTLTTVNGPRATLAQVPRLLTETGYRARVVRQLSDELLTGFWQAYEDLTPAGRSAVIGPVMNKLRAVLLRPFVRDALASPVSSVDLGRHLDGGGICLVRAPKGVLGDDATRLLGSVLLAHTWQAVTRRSRQAQAVRHDAAIYVDECHNFLNLPGSIADVLAEARAYRLSLVLAHQHLAQLPKDLREAISADARNKLFFAVSPEDAADLKAHVGPVLSAHDLTHLGAFQAVGRLVVDGAATSAFTFRTRPLPAAVPEREAQVRQASRATFATTGGPVKPRNSARANDERLSGRAPGGGAA